MCSGVVDAVVVVVVVVASGHEGLFHQRYLHLKQ